jgi:hypothetical protein
MKHVKLIHHINAEETQDNLQTLSSTYSSAAKIYENDGNLEKAIYCYLESAKLSLKKELLVEPPSKTTEFMDTNSFEFENFTNVVNKLEESNQKEKALEYQMRKIAVLSSLFGANDDVIVKEYMDLGQNLLKSNNLEKAKTMMLKSLEMQESKTIKNNFNVIVNKCDKILVALKEVLTKDELISINLKAIQNEKLRSPVKVENLKKYYANLYEIYSKNGETEKANEMKLLADSSRSSSDYIKLYQEASEKGKKFESEGNIDDAVECYLESMKYGYLSSNDPIKQKHLIDNLSLRKIIEGFMKSKNFERYIQLNEKKLKVLSSLLGDNHEIVENEYLDFANCLESAETPKLIELKRKLININIARNGENHVDIVRLYQNLGLTIEVNEKRFDEPLDLYMKAINIEISLNGDSTPKLLELYNNVSRNYLNRKDFNNALVYLHKILDIKVAQNGEFHPENKGIYEEIAQHYMFLDDYSKHAEYSEKKSKC